MRLTFFSGTCHISADWMWQKKNGEKHLQTSCCFQSLLHPATWMENSPEKQIEPRMVGWSWMSGCPGATCWRDVSGYGHVSMFLRRCVGPLKAHLKIWDSWKSGMHQHQPKRNWPKFGGNTNKRKQVISETLICKPWAQIWVIHPISHSNKLVRPLMFWHLLFGKIYIINPEVPLRLKQQNVTYCTEMNL